MYNCMIAAVHQGSAATILDFAEGLTTGFHNLGLPAAMVPLAEDGREVLLRTYERLFREGHSPFLLDINGRIGTGNVPKFSWVVDHPLTHPQLGAAGTHTVLGLIDRAHTRLTGYSPAPATFQPHGGPEPDDCPIPWDDRDIDVLFVGNVFPEQYLEKPLERLAYAAGAEAGRTGSDPFATLIAALAAHGADLGDFPREDICRLLSVATQESQRVERMAALLSLPPCRLHVVGALFGDWHAGLGPGLTLHGHIDSMPPILALMRRSRVVLNLSAKFPHGSHERIWYAMACGGAVITNRSSFVEQDFQQGRHVFYYQRPDEIGTLADAALSNGAGARAAAESRPIYAAGHTWEDRAARILSAMNRLAPQG